MKTLLRWVLLVSVRLAWRLADLLAAGDRFDDDQRSDYWRRFGRHVDACIRANALSGRLADQGYQLGRYYYKRVNWGANETDMLQHCRDAISKLSRATTDERALHDKRKAMRRACLERKEAP